jgi:hypothetical protein
MFMKKVIMYGLLSMSFVGNSSEPLVQRDNAEKEAAVSSLACNGYSGLCDRRYNEVTQLVSHNATSNKPSLVQDQDRSIREQLEDGIRVFKIPLHWDFENVLGYYEILLQEYLAKTNKELEALKGGYSSNYLKLILQKKGIELALKEVGHHGERAIFTCHGFPKKELYGKHLNKLIDGAPDILKPVIGLIVKPLENAPDVAVTVAFGGTKSRGGLAPYPACLLDKGAPTLESFLREIKAFLDTHPHEVITVLLNDFVEDNKAVEDVFEKTGLLPYAYVQDRETQWPTLRELIASGKRLIVFSDDSKAAEESPHLLNSRSFFTSRWNVGYAFSSAKLFIDTDTPLKAFGDFDRPISADSVDNQILEFHNIVTPGIAGSREEAAKINKKSVMGPLLKRVVKAAQHPLAWVHIDFYQVPKNEASAVIAELNGVNPTV